MLFTLAGCKKEKSAALSASEDKIEIMAGAPNALGGSAAYCIEDEENVLAYDSILNQTILGSKLIGLPYSVAVMQQAAQQILGSSAGVGVNGWYMRFKPTDADQLAALEDNDIDLFDYPLDYEVTQEGDYYDDGVTPAETIPWLYAVVPVNFITPAGITNELLQQIHVPADYRVEKRAFENTGNYVDDAGCFSTNTVNPCPDPCYAQCPDYDPGNCPGGGGGGGTTLNPRVPNGRITVTDDILNSNVPVRKARVVAKRFLKIERTFTNDLGQYQFTKSFRNKVKLNVKFKNNDAIIKGLKGIRFYQMLFPIKKNIGTYRGNLNNIIHNIEVNSTVRSRGAKLWAAATSLNSVQEYMGFATALSTGLPPQKMRIVIMPGESVTGATPMYAKRFVPELGPNFVKHVILGVRYPAAEIVNGIINYFKSRVDMFCGYNNNGVTRNSAQLCEEFYHELTHAAHYNKVGNAWYSEFAIAEFGEIFLNFLTPGEKPYGDGTGGRAGYVGLGESWAYHMGHVMTDIKYGGINMFVFEQGFAYQNNNIHNIVNNTIVFPAVASTGLNAHLNLLEDFSPLRTNDPFAWIPQGLFYDLVDNRNDELQNPQRIPLNDGVSSYTIQELFNAIDDDITTIPAYRIRLLQENSNRDAAGVTTIFNFYNF